LKLKLGLSQLTKKVYVSELANDGRVQSKTDVTESFKACVVLFCSESVEFEADGMKFRATCERIE